MVSFGYKNVSESEKDRLVRGVFDGVAHRYDLMNSLMSFGSHKIWKKLLVKAMEIKDGMKIVDMSTGTGDIAAEILGRGREVDVFAIDPSLAMMKEGRCKLTDSGCVKGIHWIVGRGESVPLAASSVDLYVIVFGLRNVTSVKKTLAEANRILKSGGEFMCLEFSPSSMGSLQGLYDFYSFKVLPFMGQVVVGDGEPYRYLAESIRTFPPPNQLHLMMKDAGFINVEHQDWNLVALHRGIA